MNLWPERRIAIPAPSDRNDLAEAIRILKILAGQIVKEDLYAPDVNQNGKKDLAEAIYLLGRVADLPQSFPLFRMLQIPVPDHRVSFTNHRGAVGELTAPINIHAAPVHLSWNQTGPRSCADEAGYGADSRFAAHGVFIVSLVSSPQSKIPPIFFLPL